MRPQAWPMKWTCERPRRLSASSCCTPAPAATKGTLFGGQGTLLACGCHMARPSALAAARQAGCQPAAHVTGPRLPTAAPAMSHPPCTHTAPTQALHRANLPSA